MNFFVDTNRFQETPVVEPNSGQHRLPKPRYPMILIKVMKGMRAAAHECFEDAFPCRLNAYVKIKRVVSHGKINDLFFGKFLSSQIVVLIQCKHKFRFFWS